MHTALHISIDPHTGNGFHVCACGATLRIEKGKPVGGWHTCKLCTHQNWHHPPKENEANG